MRGTTLTYNFTSVHQPTPD